MYIGDFLIKTRQNVRLFLKIVFQFGANSRVPDCYRSLVANETFGLLNQEK